MSLVLVVGRDTHEADPPTDLVVAELRRRGVSVLHLDPDEDREWQVKREMFAPARPEQAAVAAELSGTDWAGRLRVSVIRDGDTNREHRQVALESITGIYYRRSAAHPDDPGMVAGEHRHDIADQARLARTGLLLAAAGFRERVWLNHPHRAALAEYTAVQLHAAQAVGLHVPRTCLTDDPATAARFVREVGAAGGVLVKLVRGRGIADHDDDLAVDLVAVYTPGYGDVPGGDYPGVDQPCPVPITVAECDERIRAAVHLLQHRIPTSYQARLTVVDDRLFATRIDTAAPDDPDGHLYRPCGAPTHLRYRPTTAPAPVAHAAARFLHHFGLRTATFDFVVDPDGRWWFLGANPHGGWARAHHEIGHPIPAALADALTGPVPATVHELPGPGPTPAPPPFSRRASA